MMKTVLVTGGASGLGKGISLRLLAKGDQVIAVGSSKANGDAFRDEARQQGAMDRAIFIQADLSLVGENQRVIAEIEQRFPKIDALVFCASKHSKAYTETREGFELTFALDYLSRYILGYGLKECLEKADDPVILNICGSGMDGAVNWNDLQHKNAFNAQKVMMHGSRLNDLSGVGFSLNDTVSKIRYILYNPWAVQTPGMMEVFGGAVMKTMYKIIGKPIEKAAVPVVDLLNRPPAAALSAYRERKALSLNHASYNSDNAKRLYSMTVGLLKEYGVE